MFPSPLDKKIAFIVLDGSSQPVASPPEGILSDKACGKRKKEFSLGRAAAQLALQELGFNSPPAVSRGESGEPLWPDGITGSITHTEDYAVVAAGRKEDYLAIGIDLEALERKQKYDISTRIALPEELDWIKQEAELTGERTITLFSAKESVYKALFPVCRVPLYFKDVLLTWNEKDKSFSGLLQKDLDPFFPAAEELLIGTLKFENLVFTYLTMPAKGDRIKVR